MDEEGENPRKVNKREEKLHKHPSHKAPGKVDWANDRRSGERGRKEDGKHFYIRKQANSELQRGPRGITDSQETSRAGKMDGEKSLRH